MDSWLETKKIFFDLDPQAGPRTPESELKARVKRSRIPFRSILTFGVFLAESSFSFLDSFFPFLPSSDFSWGGRGSLASSRSSAPGWSSASVSHNHQRSPPDSSLCEIKANFFPSGLQRGLRSGRGLAVKLKAVEKSK